jgi:hypothetical protein
MNSVNKAVQARMCSENLNTFVCAYMKVIYTQIRILKSINFIYLKLDNYLHMHTKSINLVYTCTMSQLCILNYIYTCIRKLHLNVHT